MRAVLVEPNPLIADALGRQLGMGKIRYDRLEWAALEELLAEQGGEALGFDAIVLGGLAEPARAVAQLRAQRVTAAVLCLLERRCVATTVALLHAGADDVLVKPVVSAEVRARIEVARRRARGLVSNAVRVGRLTVYLDGRDPEVGGAAGGERLRLSQREHAILGVLAAHHRRVVSKEHIYDEVYGLSGADPLDKVIDVYICKLRKKIAEATGGARYIETVYGRGYKFEAPPEHEDGTAVTVPAVRRLVPPFQGFGRSAGEPVAAVG